MSPILLSTLDSSLHLESLCQLSLFVSLSCHSSSSFCYFLRLPFTTFCFSPSFLSFSLILSLFCFFSIVSSRFLLASFLYLSCSFLSYGYHIFAIQEVLQLLPHATGFRVQTTLFFRHRFWSDLPAGGGMCWLLFRDQTIPSDGHCCVWFGLRDLRLCASRHHAAGELQLAGGEPDPRRTDPQLCRKCWTHRVRDQYCANRAALCFTMSLIS